MTVGLVLTVVALGIASRRLWWLKRLAFSVQPAPERFAAVRAHPAGDVETQATEVIGQRKLFKWSVPGAAHAATFWGFIVLILTIIEAYGDIFDRTFAIPGIGHWAAIGFIEDLFSVGVLAGIITFTVIRVRNNPNKEGRASRFFGSHTRAAWVVLSMIAAVIVTLLLYRGAQQNTGVFPYPHAWAFASWVVAQILHPLGYGVNSVLEVVFLLAQLGVIMAFAVIVVYSKHLHIVLAPVNVLFSRRPNALGALEPMRSNGKVLDFEEADPDTDVFGLGKIEDFTWKGLLDMATCTECGRCQSQCPAWATDKPLSPKQVILDLRDHAFAKAPYLLTPESARDKLPDAVKAEAERPLVGTKDVNGVIDPDVLWSCTNCGACVEECPVDIEHIDHIDGMRRYQVLIESAFPVEAAGMLKNLENKGDPWGMGGARRAEWMTELDFEVPVVDGKIDPDVEYLFWVGCAGALEDRARKTTKAIATLLHTAGVKFAVLGPAETCTGDPARRIGNEFVYSMLAQQNIETLNEAAPKTIVASCPHCFNTIANEYPQLGGNYEVVHHTQLLARLVDQGKLTPAVRIDEKLTYHDPCFLGRHNKIFTPPREILEAVPGVEAEEMHRCKNRGFCCGAGGARMWMEERIGKRINTERIDEALELNPDTISTACPYCLVMLGDAVAAKKASGEAKDTLEVVDVAQLLARSVTPAEGRPGSSDLSEWTVLPQSAIQGGLLGVGVAAAVQIGPVRDPLVGRSGRQVPDDLQHHHVRIARAGRHPDVAGPARRAQDIPGSFQVTAGDPGPAPQRDPFPERRRRRVHDDRQSAVPGLDPGVPAAGRDPVRRDDAPGPPDQPPPRRRPGQCGRQHDQTGENDRDQPGCPEHVAAGQRDRGQPGRQPQLVAPAPDQAEDPRPRDVAERVFHAGHHARVVRPPRPSRRHG
jgi:Fe-S oxidoreductase